MKTRWLWVISILLLLSCNKSSSSPQTRWLAYEPSIVELSGQLSSTDKYGPPNYGESPETDPKIKILLLKLDTPIAVKGDAGAELNQDSFDKLTELQMICTQQATACQTLIGQHILAKGTLSQAISGHHFTPVVLNIQEVKKEKLPQNEK